LRRELRDRYGPLPQETEALLETTALRLLGTELGIERILVRPWDARINFRSGVMIGMNDLQRAFTERQFDVELARPIPLSLTLQRRGPQSIAASLVAALRALAPQQARAA
jgi:transcription-repair coupling factor (superfamily II helicase)